MSKLEDVLSKEVYRNSNASQTGILGAQLPAAGRFFVIFWKKKAVLTPLDYISHVFRAPFKSSRFLTFESQLKKLSCSVLLLLVI